jgi:UDP-2,3-diacylglucosamine hydrolase
MMPIAATCYGTPVRPPTWIIADAHAGAHPQSDRALLDLLDALTTRRADLLIMGDLFLAWLAPPRFWTPFQREVMDRLAALKRMGRVLRFVVGNRDYLVKEALSGTIFDAVHEDGAIVELGGEPTLVAHGDLANGRDLAYRAWRRISRSGPATRLLSSLPAAVGRSLAERTERRLSSTNRRYKSGELPIAALEALGRSAQERGAARVIVGHFHHDRALDVSGGAPVIVAPGWFEHRRILLATPDGALRSIALETLRSTVD